MHHSSLNVKTGFALREKKHSLGKLNPFQRVKELDLFPSVRVFIASSYLSESPERHIFPRVHWCQVTVPSFVAVKSLMFDLVSLTILMSPCSVQPGHSSEIWFYLSVRFARVPSGSVGLYKSLLVFLFFSLYYIVFIIIIESVHRLYLLYLHIL